MNNQIHNSINKQENEEPKWVVLIELLFKLLKLIFRYTYKFIHLIFVLLTHLIQTTTNKLKPHFLKFEELLFRSAKQFFGL